MSIIHFISPHIDDAVLSCGGLIDKLSVAGYKVKVYSVFSVSNWTNAFSISGETYARNIDAVTRLRKEEEAAVSRRLRYELHCLDHMDFCIRGNPDQRRTVELTTVIADQIRRGVEKTAPCFFPSGEAHPDHSIIRGIGYLLLNEGYNIVFYEDQPYASSAFSKGYLLYNAFTKEGFVPYLVDFNWESKVEAIREYRSQVSNVWIRNIHNYAYDLEGNKFYERFWQPVRHRELPNRLAFFEERNV